MDNVYRLDHAVTATQKTILKAFGVDEDYIKSRATRLGDQLKAAAKQERDVEDGSTEEDDID